MAIKLYEHPLSPYAQKVKIALYEKGIPFTSEIPDLFGKKVSAEFSRTSPRREVPTLIDDGNAIFDSSIILEYLEDRFRQPALRPATPLERARSRMIEEMCDTHYDAINWGITEIRTFKRATGELSEKMLERARQQTVGMHDWLERRLGTRPFFTGEAFGHGDVAVIPFVAASTFLGHAPRLSTRLATWFEAMRARESVKKVLIAAAEYARKSPIHVVGAGMARLYRDHRIEWMLRSGGESIIYEGIAKQNIRFTPDIT